MRTSRGLGARFEPWAANAEQPIVDAGRQQNSTNVAPSGTRTPSPLVKSPNPAVPDGAARCCQSPFCTWHPARVAGRCQAVPPPIGTLGLPSGSQRTGMCPSTGHDGPDLGHDGVARPLIDGRQPLRHPAVARHGSTSSTHSPSRCRYSVRPTSSSTSRKDSPNRPDRLGPAAVHPGTARNSL